jgi:hypothetical protein
MCKDAWEIRAEKRSEWEKLYTYKAQARTTVNHRSAATRIAEI